MAEEVGEENKKEDKKVSIIKAEGPKTEGPKTEGPKAEGAKEDKKKEKRPTALKRILQSTMRNKFNRQHKAKIKTACKDFMDAIEKKESKDVLIKKTNLINSLLDKASKKNIFKKNKAARLKSKYTLLLNK